MYRKALHSFFLKVHPDFFGSHPQWQQTNESSIAQLNELLDWAKSFKAGRYSPPPSKKATFSFFRKPDDDELTTIEVKTTFELPHTFQPTESNKGAAERAVNKFLRDLLRRAKCLEENEAMISQAQDDTQRREEKRHNIERQRKPTIYRQKTPSPRTLLDEAADSIVAEWGPKAAPHVDDLMMQDQIIFSRELSPVQCAAAVRVLQDSLHEMSYNRWHHIPLVIGNDFTVGGHIPASITVPWNFTVPRFLAFLNAHESEIEHSREQLYSTAKRVEGLIASISRQLDCDDVLLTNVKSTEALKTLDLIYESIPLFQQYGVTGVTLEVAPVEKCAHRRNGVVIVCQNVSEQELAQFLRIMAPRMEALRQVYKDAKQMIDSTLWHIKKFQEMVKPSSVEPFLDNVSYYQRLQWAKELLVLAPQIVQWDWSDFSFGLGPLEIDWEHNTILLPHNFDAANFARYVKDVHEKSKTRERNKLVEGEEQRLLFEAKKTASEVHQQLTGSGELIPNDDGRQGQEDGENSAGRIPREELAFQRMAREGRGDPTVMNAGDGERAYMSEYMAPNPKGDEHLTTERPLHHQVHFDTEEDARDQLEWEGMYQSPYTSVLPDSTYDDISVNFLKTNRKHREAVVKKVIDEMNERSGRQFRSKLGDKLGLSSATPIPRGFPVKAKGTYQGPGRPERD